MPQTIFDEIINKHVGMDLAYFFIECNSHNTSI